MTALSDNEPQDGATAAQTDSLNAPSSLSAGAARRIFLHAQGLSRRRRPGAVGDRQFGEYLRRQGVLQLDSVNVLARAHYLPLFSRYGAYDRAKLDEFLWGTADGHSPHAFEYWGHEAAVTPLELLPAMSVKMLNSARGATRGYERLESTRPGLIAQVRDVVEADGPFAASELDHLAPRAQTSGPWWDYSDAKSALEYLFTTGGIAASRRGHFRRTYDSTQRAWGRPAADAGAWPMAPAQAQQSLFDHALAAVGIGTPRDVADHFRQKPATASALAEGAVRGGSATWVTVADWDEPALLAREAVDPGRATGAALLNPFDPVCWYRPRLERMFGMEYRIEIYTPAAKRVYGYYTLPFLLGDHMVARFDLKADRASRTLLVLAAWREPHFGSGSRRRTDEEVALAAHTELSLLAGWLGLDHVRVETRGNLAAALRSASVHFST